MANADVPCNVPNATIPAGNHMQRRDTQLQKRKEKNTRRLLAPSRYSVPVEITKISNRNAVNNLQLLVQRSQLRATRLGAFDVPAD